MTMKSPSRRKFRIGLQVKWIQKQAWMTHWHPLRPSVSPMWKKAGLAEVSGADLVAIATKNETKVHRGPGRHESVKDWTNKTIAAAEATKDHRRVTREPRKDRKSEADGVDKHRSGLMKAVNLPDVENEAVGALVSE